MSRPFPPGGPGEGVPGDRADGSGEWLLGPFRLSARLSEPPAGVVFLAVDPRGRLVSVAVLTRGAAADAAARDRFRAAIEAELGRGAAGGVVGAEPVGPAPWVAVPYEPGAPTAERFLERVPLPGGPVGGGPGFLPYWSESRDPALPWLVAGPPPEAGPVVVERSVARWVLGLAGGLVALVALLVVLYACAPSVSPPVVPPPSDVPSPSLTRVPGVPPPSVSPRRSLGTSTGPSASPSGSGGDQGGGAA